MLLQRSVLRSASRRQVVAFARDATRLTASSISRSIQRPTQQRTFLKPSETDPTRASMEALNVERLARKRQDYEKTRTVFLSAGVVAGIIAIGAISWRIKTVLEQNPTKLDAGSAGGDLSPRKVVVHDKDGREMVPTGNSTVPEFPRTFELPEYEDGDATPIAPTDATEYTLVGVGLRTVSFLSIQVYVVGYYIATADIAALQDRLAKKINPIATTLIPSEKEELRAALLDPAKSEEIWRELLKDDIPARSLFRVVPVRDTDFHHLRDGFVRSIQANFDKSDDAAEKVEGSTDFGESVRQFRHIFNRGKAPRQKELLMVRGKGGRLTVVYDDGRSFGRQTLGSVDDERLSRALWMNYLGGVKVASEPARKSIADGIIEFVERPVGTVAAQVV